MPSQDSDLYALFESIVQDLRTANDDRRHPFRTLVLATQDFYPAMRTVVKRFTDIDLSTLIYTDARSAKVENLEKNENASMLFYDPLKRVQVTIKGRCEVIKSGFLFDKHQKIALQNPGDYSTLDAPGRRLDSETYEMAKPNYFCLLRIIAQEIEILELGREQHRRARFLRKEEWEGSWLVP